MMGVGWRGVRNVPRSTRRNALAHSPCTSMFQGMFAAACRIASEYTRPVVISTRQVNGRCASGIGAFVVVNSDGWIVTVWHLVEEMQKLAKMRQEVTSYHEARAAIEKDGQLSAKEKKRRLLKLGQLSPKAVSAFAVWWALDGANAVDCAAIPACDLALVSLQPFDPSWVASYPVFKNPAKDCAPGTSLCRLGYPFHSIEPTYDAAQDTFNLPPGSVPLPLFPIDGILTRFVEIHVTNEPKPTFPLLFL